MAENASVIYEVPVWASIEEPTPPPDALNYSVHVMKITVSDDIYIKLPENHTQAEKYDAMHWMNKLWAKRMATLLGGAVSTIGPAPDDAEFIEHQP